MSKITDTNCVKNLNTLLDGFCFADILRSRFFFLSLGNCSSTPTETNTTSYSTAKTTQVFCINGNLTSSLSTPLTPGSFRCRSKLDKAFPFFPFTLVLVTSSGFFSCNRFGRRSRFLRSFSFLGPWPWSLFLNGQRDISHTNNLGHWLFPLGRSLWFQDRCRFFLFLDFDSNVSRLLRSNCLLYLLVLRWNFLFLRLFRSFFLYFCGFSYNLFCRLLNRLFSYFLYWLFFLFSNRFSLCLGVDLFFRNNLNRCSFFFFLLNDRGTPTTNYSSPSFLLNSFLFDRGFFQAKFKTDFVSDLRIKRGIVGFHIIALLNELSRQNLTFHSRFFGQLVYSDFTTHSYS